MRQFTFIAPNRAPAPKIDLSGLMAEYASKGGSVRQFKRGDSGSVDGHMIFLQERGYVLKPHNGIMYKIRAPGEKTLRAISRSALVALIDRLRVAEGREPMRSAAA
jgi:hypothetical protein